MYPKSNSNSFYKYETNSSDDNILFLDSLRQVQNIIKLEPSVDRFLLHFVMLDSLPLKFPEESCFMK